MSEELDLIGISEIAEILRVSRQRVDKLSRTDPGFPAPVAKIHAGRIWRLSDVAAWLGRRPQTHPEDRP